MPPERWTGRILHDPAQDFDRVERFCCILAESVTFEPLVGVRVAVSVPRLSAQDNRHLIVTIDELQALGSVVCSPGEGIDATTPAGRLQLHVLAAIAEFERARIAQRVQAGLASVCRQRPCAAPVARFKILLAQTGSFA